MLIITYDFSNDKLRSKFSKFLKKYGRRVQYSVFEIKNSPRILAVILTEIKNVYERQFSFSDSILIFPVSPADTKKVVRYGWPVQEEEEVVMFGEVT